MPSPAPVPAPFPPAWVQLSRLGLEGVPDSTQDTGTRAMVSGCSHCAGSQSEAPGVGGTGFPQGLWTPRPQSATQREGAGVPAFSGASQRGCLTFRSPEQSVQPVRLQSRAPLDKPSPAALLRRLWQETGCTDPTHAVREARARLVNPRVARKHMVTEAVWKRLPVLPASRGGL